MTRETQDLGAAGECAAVRYLVKQGMAMLDRNWRGASGEVDVIARDGDALVFVEVKTRRSRRFGQPVEAIVPAKVRRMRRLAAQWLAVSRVRPREVRFDVVSVLPQRDGEPPRIEHLRAAF
jgi:putative endonuclease